MRKKLRNVLIITILYIGLILIGTKVYAATGTTSNSLTRIRKEASTTSDIIGIVAANSKVEILSESGDWYKVKYTSSDIGTVTGYIRKDLLKTEKEDSTNSNKNENVEKKEDKKEEEKSSEEEATEKEDSKKEISENSKIKLNSSAEVKLLPIVFANVIGNIEKDSEVTVTEIIGNWYYLESGKQNGWISKAKLEGLVDNANDSTETKTEESKKEETTTVPNKTTTYYVATTTLNLRETASTEAKILTQLQLNDKVTVIEKVDNTWSKVKAGNYTGYVAGQFLTTKKPDVTSRLAQELREAQEAARKAEEKAEKERAEAKAKAEAEAKAKAAKEAAAKKASAKKTTTDSSSSKKSSKVTGSDIIAYAKKYLGCKYVYGATGPNTFDCSGFTQYVYKHFGYSISRTSTSQRGDGKVIKSKSDLQLGDIVCFPGHVGLYVGGGNFIHASHTGSDVKISSLSSSYYKNKFIQGTRILK